MTERGNYTSTSRPKLIKKIGLNGEKRMLMRFKTYSFSSLNFIHDSFYRDKVKIIPRDIGRYLTPLSLAVWIMDDGAKSSTSIKLCTESFNRRDLEFLQSVIESKFGIRSKLHRSGKGHNIYIVKADLSK